MGSAEANKKVIDTIDNKELKVVLVDMFTSPKMKPIVTNRNTKRRSDSFQWEDENVKYKLNLDILKGMTKKPEPPKEKLRKSNIAEDENEDILYKFPERKQEEPIKVNKKVKPANTKFKVRFWSLKEKAKQNKNRHIAFNKTDARGKTGSPKLRSKVSSLPPPLFTDQHAPMVTVPDDLTIHFNEEEANDLLMTAEPINTTSSSRTSTTTTPNKTEKRTPHPSPPQNSPKSPKRKHNMVYEDTRANDSELEFFAKYIVQKLRKMETNQRIYSENLINTVLMFGQLKKLNGKSRINDT